MSTDESKRGKSPFLRPVVLFRKQREEFLREKWEDLPAQPQEKSVSQNYLQSTLTSRMKTRPRILIQDIVPETEEDGTDAPALAASVLSGSGLKKLSLSDYREEQRQKVYTKYADSIKRSMDEKLWKDLEREMKEVTEAKKRVEEEETAFRKLIEDKQEKLSEALQLSEKQSKLKTEVTEEFQRKSAEAWELRSNVENLRKKLKEYTEYKDFLTDLAPGTWREQQAQKREEQRRVKLEKLKSEEAERLAKGAKKKELTSKKKKRTQKPRKKSAKKSNQEEQCCQIGKEEISDSDEEPAIYFTEPMDVLPALEGMAEDVLVHIKDFQDTEEDMIRINRVLKQTKAETSALVKKGNDDIERLESEIKAVEEIASDLALKCKLFFHGEYVNEEKEMKDLHDKVKGVYDKCVDEGDTNTLSMLTAIERRTDYVLQLIKDLPPGKLKAIERAWEAERKAQKPPRLERRMQAAEGAAPDAKRKTSRKLMYRSQPPKIKKKDQNPAAVKKTQEQLDYEYFFTL